MLFSAHCSTLVPYWQKGKVLLTKIKKKKERRSCCAGKSEIKMGVEVRIGSKLVGGEGERGSKCWSVDRGGGEERGEEGGGGRYHIKLKVTCCTISYCGGLLTERAEEVAVFIIPYHNTL